ncbi:MAG: metallo-beta-lactamase family protein [Rickettsiales bacterium]|jgi:hydroxyacylglutathione hydrolase|nr:metallo-beta-lactamase family protein [Rickettsiales bacterium]
MLTIHLLPARQDNYIFLLRDDSTGTTAAVDPADAAPVLEALHTYRYPKLDYILNTHHHGDHVGGNLALKEAMGCKIVGFAEDAHRIPGIDIKLTKGACWKLGMSEATMLFLPGHTLGHIAFYFKTEAALFCGDTLFSLGCGRLFEGTPEQMWESLSQLMALPPETRVFCAHEYTEANGRFALHVEPNNRDLQLRIKEVADLREKGIPTIPSTIGLECATNPFLRVNQPEIQKHLGVKGLPPSQIFGRLRKEKDHF